MFKLPVLAVTDPVFPTVNVGVVTVVVVPVAVNPLDTVTDPDEPLAIDNAPPPVTFPVNATLPAAVGLASNVTAPAALVPPTVRFPLSTLTL